MSSVYLFKNPKFTILTNHDTDRWTSTPPLSDFLQQMAQSDVVGRCTSKKIHGPCESPPQFPKTTICDKTYLCFRITRDVNCREI